MMAKIDVMPLVDRHHHHHHPASPSFRGASPPKPGPMGPEHTFHDVLAHLEDENLCACGGKVGPARFAHLLATGCGGYHGVPPPLLALAAVFFITCWMIISSRVVRCLGIRHTIRSGAAPSTGRRIV